MATSATAEPTSAAAVAAAEAATAAALAVDELRKAEALEQSSAAPLAPPEQERAGDAPATSGAESETVPPSSSSSHTQSIPVVDLDQLEVAELGLADRLGLGETDPDDEVGPTS